MRMIILSLISAVSLFAQTGGPAERGYTVIDLPAWVSLAGYQGGFCGIENSVDPTIKYWQAGVQTLLLEEKQLNGAKFVSSQRVWQNEEMDRLKLLCFGTEPPLVLAYSAQVPTGYELRSLFSGTREIIGPNQPIELKPIGQLNKVRKLFVDGGILERSANRMFMLSTISDSSLFQKEDRWFRIVELSQPYSQPFTLLADTKEPSVSQFDALDLGCCASATGFWVPVTNTKSKRSGLVYHNRVSKWTIVKDGQFEINTSGCNPSGTVLAYTENGTLKLSRFSEFEPGYEVPLMVGNNFAGFKLVKILSLKVLDDETIFFVAETDKGNAVFKLAFRSATPELVKGPGEAPYGSPISVVQSSNTIAVTQLEGGITMKMNNFLITKEPVIAISANPTILEPGQQAEVSFEIKGQFKSWMLDPVVGMSNSFSSGAKVVVYPKVTTTYTLRVEWVGGPTIAKSVTITVLPLKPSFKTEGVVNSASFGPELSPGVLATIFGKGLATQTTQTGMTPLPITLGGVQVQIDGLACPLLFVSEGQINFQIPSTIQPGMRKIRVIRDNIFSDEVAVLISDFAPALFAVSRDQGMYFDSSYQLAGSRDNPLQKGETYFAYATGLASTCGIPAGQPAPLDQLCYAVPEVFVRFGGQPAEVLFAGLAPGLLVYQINFRVPMNSEEPGQLELTNVILTVNGRESAPSPVYFSGIQK
ncbi:MAG: hypothetical protein AAB837_00190 [Patescibacteria group bacterium]